jgi:thiol-disulfide isomerase/thioredoxin
MRMVATILVVLLGARTLPSRADGIVHFYYFFDPTCSSCAEVHKQVLEPLLAKYGASIAAEELSIGDKVNFDLMLAMEKHYQVTASSIPEVYIGDKALIGPDEITTGLEQQIQAYLQAGGVALPADVVTVQPTATPTPPPAGASGNAVVKVMMFYSPTCPHCENVLKNILPPIQQKYGPLLEIRTVNIYSAPTQQFWYDVMTAFNIGADSHYVPMLFIGTDVLVGDKIISDTLPGLIDTYLSKGGTEYPLAEQMTDALAPILPIPKPAGAVLGPPAPIYIVYFYQGNCTDCPRAEADLNIIVAQHPQVVIRRFDIQLNLTLYQYLGHRAGVPVTQTATIPALFVGDKYLLGDQLSAPGIETLITPYLETGSPEPWTGFDATQVANGTSAIDRFHSFTLTSALGAGLVDGINPFLFAIMCILITLVVLRQRKGSRLFAVGGTFVVGIFIAILASVGSGFAQYLMTPPFLHTISVGLYAFLVLLCLLLALSIIGVDFQFVPAKPGEKRLTLPERLRYLALRPLPEKTENQRETLGALILGILVALVTFTITQSAYLSTIGFALNDTATRTQALLALLLYTVMYILPAIGIFEIATLDMNSRRLMDTLRHHTRASKLAGAVLFLLLAVWLTMYLLA